MAEYTTISVPKDLHEAVADLIEDTSFTSVSEFTKHVLRDIVADGAIHTADSLSADEVEKVRERLQKLGYIQ